MPKLLVVFVEGADDVRFVERVFRPRFKRARYADCVSYAFAKRTTEEINGYLDCLARSEENFDYVFLADRDTHQTLEACRRHHKARLPALKEDRVFMVCAEVEAWYFAGLSAQRQKAYGITYRATKTDGLTKEQFYNLIPPRYQRDRLVFMIELLEHYSVSRAKQRNDSFKTFCDANQAVVALA